MISQAKTSFDELIYPQDWREWRDPAIPEFFNPVQFLFDRSTAASHDEKIALLVDGQGKTFRQFRTLVMQASRGLRDLGLRPGERLLFFGTDSLEYLAAWLGAIHAGIVPAVVSDLYKANDLRYFLEDTGARALFIDVEQSEKLKTIKAELPASLTTIIVRNQTPNDPRSNFRRHVTSIDEVLANDGIGPINLHHRDDLCYMFYSGGTTGRAKGITHLPHDFLLVPERQGRFWEYNPEDIVFATSKKYFTHGLWPGVLIPLYFGATSVIQRQPPTPDAVINILTKSKATKFITVPTVLKNLLEHCRTNNLRPDFSSVKMVVSASEKIPPEIFDRFRAAFDLEIFDSIGSAEITYEWIANRRKQSKQGSLGKPVFGYEIRLVDHDGNDVTEPNVAGEAWVKSRTACFFYWRKFDKSRETFIGPWTRTGDKLFFDEDGFFWFAGRENDVFKVKGLWVSPIEIEAALTDHPAVLEAAVVNYEDSDGMTMPQAFIVLRPTFQQTHQLIEELKARVRILGGYKVPQKFQFLEELPRTTLLKIDRRALRAIT